MITLYLMGEKGLKVLMKILQYRSIIAQVICARDKNVQNDYYEDIKQLCADNDIMFRDRVENVSIESNYSFAIGWRWIINTGKGNKLIVLHDSLLPKYRGFAPLVNMLIKHESRIGVTALFASRDFDKGDIIAQKSIDVHYPIRIHNAIELVSELYGDLVWDIISKIDRGCEISAKPQNEMDATYSLWRNEDDYEIDWRKDSVYIQQFIYSLGFPFRGAYSSCDGEKFRFYDCEIVDDVVIENRCPGKVLFIKDGCPVVVCGEGLLRITQMETDNGVACLPLKKFRMWFK